MAVTLEGTYRLIDRASPALDRIERRADAADRALKKLGRTMDKVEARSMASKVTGLSGEMGKLESSTGRVEKAMKSAGVSNRQLSRGFEDTRQKTRGLHSDMGRLETAMRKVVTVSAGLGKVLAPGKLLLIAAAIKPVIGAVSSLAAGAVALVSQVGQATGAIVPLISKLGDLAGAGAAAATIMLSVKAAALVTKFAMSGVTQAIHGNVAAFKKLTPEARAFVMEMRKLQPIMNTIRTSAQKGLFPGLTGAIKTARANGAFQVANTAAGNIGQAVGGVADRAVSQLTAPDTLRQIAGLSSTASVVITRLGAAASNLATAFIGVLAAARPLTEWIVRTIDHWSRYLLQQEKIRENTGQLSAYFARTKLALQSVGRTARDFGSGFMTIMRIARGESGKFGAGIEGIARSFRSWTDNVQNQSRIALFFEHARDSAHRLGIILLDTLKIFVGLGRASTGLGTSMTGGIDKTMTRWARWTNSFKGQNVLTRWFNGSRDTLKQLWGLVTDISKALGTLSQGSTGATGLIRDIRSLVPDLVKVIQSISTNIGPGLFTTVQQLAHLFATLTAASGSPLGQMLNLTAGILTHVNNILDRFKGVRVAVGIAFTVLSGALLLQKLGRLALGVDSIAAAWRRVGGATQAATAKVEGYAAAEAGAGAMAAGVGAAGVAGATERAVGMEGGGAFGYRPSASAATVQTEEALAAQTSRTRNLRGFLTSGKAMTAAGLGIPIAGGLATALLQSNGTIGSHTGGMLQGAFSGAGTGAMVGSMIEPGFGTAIGAGVGAAGGLLMGGMGGGKSPVAAYLASLANTAKASGFDINQIQGGAQNLAQGNAYQRVLDQSRTHLLSSRATIANSSADSSFKKPMLEQIDKQLAANQKLRADSISHLGIERAQLKVEEKKTEELRKQARASQSRNIAGGLLTSYGNAYNVYRKGGMSVKEATDRTIANMESRAKKLNPAGAQVLFAGGTSWLAQMKKEHPELSKEYDSWNTDMKGTLKKMGVTISVAGANIHRDTMQQWTAIKTAMQDPVEKAHEFMSKQFTQMQQDARGILIGLGYSTSAANSIIRGMEGGHSGPSAVTAGSGGAPSFSSLTKKPKGFAGGGRIPGHGLNDTVPLGGMAAPGELIVNRHTEARVNAKLSRTGSTLGGLVAGETKRHSDILPGYAMGGRYGAAIAEANRMSSLHSTYSFGGGHVTPAPGSPPWDCSSSTSRVLQAAGYGNPTMTAQQFMTWGDAGPGEIGIAASPGHVYMMLGGRPWGTSTSNPGGGPGWIKNGSGWRPGFVKRHAPNPNAGAGGGGGAMGAGSLPAAFMSALGYTGTGGGVPYAASLRVGDIIARGFAGRIASAVGGGSRSGARAGGGGLGIVGGGPASSTLRGTSMLSGNQAAYLSAMARVTGLDPNVLGAWLRNEEPKTNENTDPIGHGRYNFLNVGITDSAPYGAASKWWNTNPSMAGAATGNWLLGRLSIPGFGKSAASIQALGSVAGQSPQAQIAAIQNSGWASGGETAMPALYKQIAGGYSKGGRTPDWGGWHADGLDRTFDRPTMIGVGEKGREHVKVTPSGQGGSARHVTVNVGDVIIQGGTNMQPSDLRRVIDESFDELARKIERQALVEG